jgi:hypothetical protein
MIEVANYEGAYVAFHAGTTRHGSNLEGLREALELSAGYSVHVPHINSYLRGMNLEPVQEVLEALRLLMANPKVVSESHLAPFNGAPGKCVDGIPVDHIARNCLKLRGYPQNRDGLSEALLDGYAHVNTTDVMGQVCQITGRAAHSLWEQAGTDYPLAFPINFRISAFLCAIARKPVTRGMGPFVVDAICTDGGVWRNVIVPAGMALVRFGALTIEEFVKKTSLAPARMFGFVGKGHLGHGADADVSIMDCRAGLPFATVVGGRVIAIGDVVVGSGGRVLTTDIGRRCVEEMGLECGRVDLAGSLFYNKGRMLDDLVSGTEPVLF